MRKVFEKHGYEVWAKWDNTAEVYELFNDDEGSAYIGCADTIAEAIPVALGFIDEQLAEARWNAS
jgi:hypothetical protein